MPDLVKVTGQEISGHEGYVWTSDTGVLAAGGQTGVEPAQQQPRAGAQLEPRFRRTSPAGGGAHRRCQPAPRVPRQHSLGGAQVAVRGCRWRRPADGGLVFDAGREADPEHAGAASWLPSQGSSQSTLIFATGHARRACFAD